IEEDKAAFKEWCGSATKTKSDEERCQKVDQLTCEPSEANVLVCDSKESLETAIETAVQFHQELAREYASTQSVLQEDVREFKFDQVKETEYLIECGLSRVDAEIEVELLAKIIESDRFHHMNLFDLLDGVESLFHGEDATRCLTEEEIGELAAHIKLLKAESVVTDTPASSSSSSSSQPAVTRLKSPDVIGRFILDDVDSEIPPDIDLTPEVQVPA
ncbi:MAG TPA: hypothetical protein VN457_04925, partial [Chlamydiales bacterium]|nr:hypothetical protein [Chlamydiales bacterium]